MGQLTIGPERADRSLTVGNFTLRFPPEHRLPDIKRLMPTYDAHLGWILREIGKADPDGSVIDVGANVGDTAAAVASFAPNPIVCVEGNPHFFNYLVRNVANIGSRVKTVSAFVHVNEIDGHGLVYHENTGTGSFHRSAGSNNECVPMISVRDLVAAFGRDLALFKTDTDGLDALIVRDFLAERQETAVIYFEFDESLPAIRNGEDEWAATFSALRERGYSMILYDNHGLPIAFAPSERPDVVEDLRFFVRQQYIRHSVRIHYLDIWAFPPSRRPVFDRLHKLRHELFF